MEAREKLLDYIKANGLLKGFVAEKVGTTKSNFTIWLKGKAKPHKHYRAAIEEVTNGAVKASDWE